jgi:hypothetical protein
MKTPFNISTRSLKDLMKQVIQNVGMLSLSGNENQGHFQLLTTGLPAYQDTGR